MDLEGAFSDSEGALLHSLPKSWGPWPLWPPGSYVPTNKAIGFSLIPTSFSLITLFASFSPLFRHNTISQRVFFKIERLISLSKLESLNKNQLILNIANLTGKAPN